MANEWDKRAGESLKQYAAFEEFLKLGPRRSFDEAYRKTYAKPTQARAPKWFREWAAGGDWIARVEAWDAAERAKEEAERARIAAEEAAEEERLRVEARARRRRLLDGLYARGVEALSAIGTLGATATLSQAAGVVKIVNEELRTEFNDQPPTKVAPTDPTGTKPYEPLTDAERARRVAALLDAARDRRAGLATGTDGAEA